MRNAEIDRLDDKLYELGIEEDSIYSEIEKIRSECNHVREQLSGIDNPWWCGKCGGEMPKESQ